MVALSGGTPGALTVPGGPFFLIARPYNGTCMGSSVRPPAPRPGPLPPRAVRAPGRYFELESEIQKNLIGVVNTERDIFLFERTGVTDAGKVQGRFRSAGVKPPILERLRVSGITVPPAAFTETLDVNL